MLVTDPHKRIKGTEAIKDPWFTKLKLIKKGSEEDKLDSEILNNLRAYRGVSALKKAVMNVLVKMTNSKEIEELREVFMRIDKDGTGLISSVELKEALKEAGIAFEEHEIENIINEVDYKGNKKINYTEFLAATISVRKILTEEKLQAIFKQFDTDSSGKITAKNIAEAFKKIELQITSSELREIMQKHDIKKDGFITYEVFRQIFFSIS